MRFKKKKCFLLSIILFSFFESEAQPIFGDVFLTIAFNCEKNTYSEEDSSRGYQIFGVYNYYKDLKDTVTSKGVELGDKLKNGYVRIHRKFEQLTIVHKKDTMIIDFINQPEMHQDMLLDSLAFVQGEFVINCGGSIRWINNGRKENYPCNKCLLLSNKDLARKRK